MSALRSRSLACLTALSLAACDAFDFGRVTGTEAPAPSAPKPASAPSSVPSAEAPRKPARIVLALGGEVALGGAVGKRLLSEPTRDLLAGIAPALEGATLVFSSLASPLTDAKELPGGTPPAPPALGAALARAKLRVVDATSASLFAAGPTGFTDTLSSLAHASVLPAGASVTTQASLPVRVTAEGVTLSVVAAGRIADKSPQSSAFRAHVALAEAARLGEAVRGVRATSDAVIASIGGSVEGVETPSPEDVALARAAVEGGADVAVLHGAKVPLGVAFVSGRPVLYGLGNLVGDPDPKNPWSGRGFLAKITLATGEKTTLDLCPYLLADGEPKLLSGGSRATQEGVFRRALVRLSDPLGTTASGDPDLHSCFRVTEKAGAPAASAAP